jgi:hypothetical protein
MKVYRIDRSKTSEYAKRHDNRLFRILAIAIVLILFLYFPILRNARAASGINFIMLFTFVFAIVFLGFIHYNNKKFTLLIAENFKIIIDKHSITRIIDLENESRLNFFHKRAYEKAKSHSGVFYTKIALNKIKSIEKKNGDLWIRPVNSSFLGEKGIVLVPRELESFNDLEREITMMLK